MGGRAVTLFRIRHGFPLSFNIIQHSFLIKLIYGLGGFDDVQDTSKGDRVKTRRHSRQSRSPAVESVSPSKSAIRSQPGLREELVIGSDPVTKSASPDFTNACTRHTHIITHSPTSQRTPTLMPVTSESQLASQPICQWFGESSHSSLRLTLNHSSLSHRFLLSPVYEIAAFACCSISSRCFGLHRYIIFAFHLPHL